MVQPLSGSRVPSGQPLVAADPENIGGTGDTVVYVTSTDAAEAFAGGRAPVDASIVCLVDSISGV
jgi:microcompartment protein CcmK/EutM